jgi:hypothetical protein
MLDKKLQLKDGQTIALVGGPKDLELAAQKAALGKADAVLVFAADRAQLQRHIEDLKRAVTGDRLTWVAYPKDKKLNTDLNRDIVRSIVNDNGLDPVRQVAVDETWSALRLKLLG